MIHTDEVIGTVAAVAVLAMPIILMGILYGPDNPFDRE